MKYIIIIMIFVSCSKDDIEKFEPIFNKVDSSIVNTGYGIYVAHDTINAEYVISCAPCGSSNSHFILFGFDSTKGQLLLTGNIWRN